MYKILMKLLNELKKRQSWCPYCGGEYVHTTVLEEPCVLRGLWFENDDEDDDE